MGVIYELGVPAGAGVGGQGAPSGGCGHQGAPYRGSGRQWEQRSAWNEAGEHGSMWRDGRTGSALRLVPLRGRALIFLEGKG